MSSFGLPSALALMWVPLHLFLAGYYLVFHYRDRAEHSLAFAVLWSLAALYALACAGLYASGDPHVGLQWQKVQLFAAAFAYPMVALFMWTFAMGRPRRRSVLGLLAISTLFALGNLATPWFWTETPSVKRFTLWGLDVAYQEMEPGWLGVLCFAWGTLLLLASLGLALRATRARQQGAAPLLVSVGVLVLCGINDSLVSSGAYAFLYLTEHGFPVFAFAAAYLIQARLLSQRTVLQSRTAELSLANQELATLDRLKEDLLANVSHELRTPLVSVRGYVEILLSGKLGPVSPSQARGLEIALRNVNRLLGLIGNLLEFAKLRDGRVELARRHVDLAAVLQAAVDTAQPLAEAKGISLEYRPSTAATLWLRGDAARLQQVLDNLLSNAVRHTGAGGAIRVGAHRAPDDTLRAWVEDTGAGIPEAEQERIFERFHRASADDAQQPGSTGIGLAISRELVRLHGGEIAVHSREGEGARFEVTLPALAERPAETMDTHAETGERAPGADPRVLLVDDDRDVVELLTLALQAEGYAIRVARDGLGALEQARRHPFDLMLLDLTMHGLGGVEVLKTLRADPGTADLPVIVVTALAGDEVRSRCLDVGANDFLVKPVAMTELLRVVRRVLGEPEPPPKPEPEPGPEPETDPDPGPKPADPETTPSSHRLDA